ncbi:hypothetical protein B566_EDAN001920 [Ephemera danica]|nr:hypothetical protein B566_EDAN001920 [Ephemera danica]
MSLRRVGAESARTAVCSVRSWLRLMTMPVIAAAGSAMSDQAKKPVARCLFGRPDPRDLERMERAAAEAEQERVRLKYGLDITKLDQLEFDVLVVPVPDNSITESQPNTTTENTSGETEPGDAAAEDMMDTEQHPEGPQENPQP